MNFNPYSNTHKGASIGFLPLFVTLLILSVHYFTGALAWPEPNDLRAQRDFNAAIGMSVVTGYFWFTLRLIHQNVASTLISLLVKTNQLSQFSHHRHRLYSSLKHHQANCIIIALLITIVYVLIEGLFTGNSELHQYILTINAVLFWFFFSLFLSQVSSNIRYLETEILVDTDSKIDHLNSIASLIRLGFVNATISLGALALFPIFWFGKGIPTLDIVIVGVFALVIGVYLFWPVNKLCKIWQQSKRHELSNLALSMESSIEGEHQDLDKIERIDVERESISLLPMFTMNLQDKMRLAACICLVLISWTFFGLIAFFS